MHKAFIAAAAISASACASLPPELQQVLDTATQPAGAVHLSESDIAAGLKEALATGTKRAISRIGVTDGFWQNPALKIPLPESLAKVEKTLRTFGQGAKVDEFQLSLNRAAEAAVPEAATIFGQAIKAMTLADARQILQGAPTAATEYFRGKTEGALSAKFAPIVARATDTVGATRKYKELVGKVGRLAPGLDMQDIDAYVTSRALAGLFHTLGDEEMRIRQDPAARTSEILRRVFSS